MSAVLQFTAPQRNDAVDRLTRRLDAQAAAYAAKVGGDASTAASYVTGLLTAELRNAYSELDRFKGIGQRPQAGCTLIEVSLGDARVLVEYEMEPGERGSMNPDSADFGPGSAPTVSIIQALINGKWVDVQDHFSDGQIERWEAEVLDGGAS